MRNARFLASLLLLLGSCCASCSGAGEFAGPDKPLNPATPFGINGLGYFHRANEKDDLQKRLGLLRELGVEWDRSDFWWQDIQPKPGEWDFAKSDAAMRIYRDNGLQIFPILCYGARWKNSDAPATDGEMAQWGEYVATVVGRYRGCANYWEVWNEPNILPFWRPQPDPAAYARLLEVTARAARKTNPDAKLVAFACADADTPFIEKVLQLAGTDDFDALSYHFYRTGIPEERTPDEVAEVRLLLQHYGKECPIWVTENGVTSNFRAGCSEELQAVRWMRQNLLMLGAGVERIFPFTLVDNLSDPGGDAALELGMVRRGGQRKPVFTAYRTMIAELGKSQGVGPVYLADNVHALLFETHATTHPATYTLAAWTTGDMADVRIRGNCVHGPQGWKAADGCGELVTMMGERRPIEYSNGVGRVCVGPAPVYIPSAGGETLRNARMQFERNPITMSPGRPETTTLTVESGTPRIEWRMPAGWTARMDGSRLLFSAPPDTKPGWYTVRALALEDTGTIAKELRVWVRPPLRADMRPFFTTATRDVPTSFTVHDTNLRGATQWFFVADPPVAGVELPAGVLMGHTEEGAARRVCNEEATVLLPASRLADMTSVTQFHVVAEPAEESRKGHVDRQRVFAIAPIRLGQSDPAVDGDLAEYEGLDPMMLGRRDQQLRGEPAPPENASAAVRAIVTTSGLFLAADITDNVPMVNGYGAGGEVYKGDAIEVYIGPSGYTGQVYARPENGFHHFALSPGRGGENPVVSDFSGEVKGSRIAARERPGGYVMEAFIPRDACGGYIPAPGEVIAWDVQLDDRDDYCESAGSKSFMWNGDDRNWLLAAKWGMAVVINRQ